MRAEVYRSSSNDVACVLPSIHVLGIKECDVCCDAKCGSCGGGADCSNHRGGADHCCNSDIEQTERVCQNPEDVACVTLNSSGTSAVMQNVGTALVVQDQAVAFALIACVKVYTSSVKP